MKKKILCWVLAVMLMLPSTVMAAEEGQTEVSQEQRKATIMVLSITGNEMTYIELDSGQEDESEAESEGMPVQEEEMPEPESGAEEAPAEDGQAGGPQGGGMPQMGGDMQDMIEAFQENGGDMSSMQDMIESFAGGGGERPEAGEEMPEQGEEMPESESGAEEVPEEGGQAGGPQGGGMPQMGGDMQDMIEAFQENGGDMSSMQDMIESFQENGGGPGAMPQMDDVEGDAEGFAAMAGATTVYLQVGLVVHADGKEKTFSILEAGDELEVLFETDDEGNEVITEMWLLSTD